MLLGALLVSFISVAFAILCPDNWMNGDNGWCYRGFDQKLTRSQAQQECWKYGATLAQVQNAFVNELIASTDFFRGDFYWLGITCNGSTPLTCYNDDGTYFDIMTYQSFYGGQPNAAAHGDCVYMATQFAFWYSGNCDATHIKYACMWDGQAPLTRLPTTTTPLPQTTCSENYHPFNGKCYKVLPIAYPETTAESICESECGHLTSIHSEQENDFVLNLARSSHMNGTYARIGLYNVGQHSYAWNDGSSFNYHNFGYEDSSLGKCVGMATTSDLVQPGQWINSPCSSPIPAVCERAPHVYCPRTTTTVPQSDCPTRFLHKNATFYSPRFPSWYNDDSVCKFILSVDDGFDVKLSFDFITLNEKSRIDLYNSLTDTTPFASINSTTAVSQSYKSNGRTMKMVFTSVTMADGNMWGAAFQKA